MRALALVVLFTILTSFAIPAPARADLPPLAKAVFALGAAYLISKNAPESEPEPAPVFTSTPAQPLRRAPDPLGTVLIKKVSGSSNATFVVADVLGAANWSILIEEDRRALEEEQRRNGGGAPGAQVSYFVTVQASFASGREYDRSQSGRYSSSSEGGREMLCTVYLRIADGAGITYSGYGEGSSWSRYDRASWRSYGWSSSERYYSPDNRDYALMAAMVAASNRIVAQVAPRPAVTPNAVPPTGQLFCPACGGGTSQGAYFCARCGVQLRPVPQTNGAPKN